MCRMTKPPLADVPIRSAADLTSRWATVLDPPIFGARSLWLMWLGADGRMAPIVVPVDDVPEQFDDRMTVGLLAEQSWVAMGLVADPITGKIRKNLPDARRGIDALADLLRHLEPDATPEEKRELQMALSNLRVNFIQQSS